MIEINRPGMNMHDRHTELIIYKLYTTGAQQSFANIRRADVSTPHLHG